MLQFLKFITTNNDDPVGIGKLLQHPVKQSGCLITLGVKALQYLIFLVYSLVKPA